MGSNHANTTYGAAFVASPEGTNLIFGDRNGASRVEPFKKLRVLIPNCGSKVQVSAGKIYRYRYKDVLYEHDATGKELRTIPIPREVKYWINFTVLPDGGVAFLDNQYDAIYFVDSNGRFVKTVKIHAKADSHLQNVSGIVVNNRLIVSENGRKELVAVDLDTYELSVFRSLRQIKGPWLSAVTYSGGIYYICTPTEIYSFSETSPENTLVASVPKGNLTGIAAVDDRLYAVVNLTGELFEFDKKTGATKLVLNNLGYPESLGYLGPLN